MRTAFVQLARLGDLASALPMMLHKHREGHEVACMVHPRYASILEGVSYVTPFPYSISDQDVSGAAQAAKDAGFDEVIRSQVMGNPATPANFEGSFQQCQWRNAGMWERFHDLPLIFDRRNTAREAELAAKYIPPPDGRPLLVYALNGWSCPFDRARLFGEWVWKNLGRRYRLLDIGNLWLPKPYDLLAFLDAADVLLTIHTLPLILSHATGTPTFVMGPDTPPRAGKPLSWFWAERRPNWIETMGYGEAMTPRGQGRILDVLAGCSLSL